MLIDFPSLVIKSCNSAFMLANGFQVLKIEVMPNRRVLIVAKLLMVQRDFVNVECQHSKLKFCCEFFYNADLNRIRKAC